MKNNLFEILVPTTLGGKIIKKGFHQVWDSKVRKISGGLTIMKTAKGNWISPDGRLFIEKMIPVRICCTEPQIHEIADMTAKYYRQEAVMFYRVSDLILVIDYDKNFGRKE